MLSKKFESALDRFYKKKLDCRQQNVDEHNSLSLLMMDMLNFIKLDLETLSNNDSKLQIYTNQFSNLINPSFINAYSRTELCDTATSSLNYFSIETGKIIESYCKLVNNRDVYRISNLDIENLGNNLLKFFARLLFFFAFFHAKNNGKLVTFIDKYNTVFNTQSRLSLDFNFASSISIIESSGDGIVISPEATKKIIFFLRQWCFDTIKKEEEEKVDKRRKYGERKQTNKSTTKKPREIKLGESKRETKETKISLKYATKDMLVDIPGIGQKYAQLLIDEISKNGLNDWKDVAKIPGIGAKKLALLQNYCTI
jgi:DNA uptake protein ComE-like DNA-binding protein